MSDASSARIDPLDEYLSSDPIAWDEESSSSFDIIGYWRSRQALSPQLASFTLNVFSIPLVSDDNERSFSSGRGMITYRRTRLQTDIIEACQSLKIWLNDLPTPKTVGEKS